MDDKIIKDTKIMGTLNQISIEEFNSEIYIIQISKDINALLKINK